jgi:hypothetical protein
MIYVKGVFGISMKQEYVDATYSQKKLMQEGEQ